MRRVNVTNFHACAFTGQTAGAKSRQTTLVRQTCKRVVLVHELRQLGGAKEFLDSCNNRADVDQRLRSNRVGFLSRHTFADGALHAGQTCANLRLNKLANCANTTVTKVINVVRFNTEFDNLATVAGTEEGLLTLVQSEHVLHGCNDVINGESRSLRICVGAELLVDLVATDLCQVVALRVEVEVVQQGACRFDVCGLAGAELAVDVDEGFFLGLDGVLLEGFEEHRVFGKLFTNLRFGHADCLEEVGNRLLALAVNTNADRIALVDFKFEPCAATRNDLCVERFTVGGTLGNALEVDARGTDELRDDNTLSAIDDKGATRGHEREIAHEHGLTLDLKGLVVHELRGHIHRCRVCVVLGLCFFDRVLRSFELAFPERKGHGLAQVLNRRNFFEDFFKTGDVGDVVTAFRLSGFDASLPRVVAQQPIEALDLQTQKVRGLKRFGELSE
ncbi:Uncharacterised protein [Chlamydia trachomatis]|nr:Uncharacterised protein [Chlamydia trachomatis]